MNLLKKCLLYYNNNLTNNITEEEIDDDETRRFTLLDMQLFAEMYYKEQCNIPVVSNCCDGEKNGVVEGIILLMTNKNGLHTVSDVNGVLHKNITTEELNKLKLY